MNLGLFVIEHLLGPERSGGGLHVEKLAGVDERRVQLRPQNRWGQIAPGVALG